MGRFIVGMSTKDLNVSGLVSPSFYVTARWFRYADEYLDGLELVELEGGRTWTSGRLSPVLLAAAMVG